MELEPEVDLLRKVERKRLERGFVLKMDRELQSFILNEEFDGNFLLDCLIESDNAA